MGAAERDEGVRNEYRSRVAPRDAGDFVVVDECGSNINLCLRSARAPRGERAYGSAPRNTEANTTLIASLTATGMGSAMLLTGATDSAAFEAYIERVLVPSLMPGKVVVTREACSREGRAETRKMDNLSAHKRPRIRELIEAQGCELWYLPAYSPDLSPIEEAFSKLKQGLRKAEARTRAVLERAIAAALDEITPEDAAGYLAHCGYGTAVGTAQ